MEQLQITPQNNAMSSKMRDIQLKMDQARCMYEKKRQDVCVKLELLDENRIKVMRQQLLLLHSATGTVLLNSLDFNQWVIEVLI